MFGRPRTRLLLGGGEVGREGGTPSTPDITQGLIVGAETGLVKVILSFSLFL